MMKYSYHAQAHGFSMNARPDVVVYLEPQPEKLEAGLLDFSEKVPDSELIFVILPDKSMSFYGFFASINDLLVGDRLLSWQLKSRIFSRPSLVD